MKKKIITTSFQETQEFGEAFGKKLTGGDVVALYGELGAGKTTLVQGIAKGLGITKRITSPTFIIVRTYRLQNHDANFFYHIDLYRLESERELQGLGIEEIISDPKNIVAIEWAEKMFGLLPKKRWDIHCVYQKNSHMITVEHL